MTDKRRKLRKDQFITKMVFRELLLDNAVLISSLSAKVGDNVNEIRLVGEIWCLSYIVRRLGAIPNGEKVASN